MADDKSECNDNAKIQNPMNLDDFSSFPSLDSQNMLSHIEGLPAQLQTAWDLGQTFPLPQWNGIERICIAGMGGSAIGADLLAAYIESQCPVPVFVHRDYDLPGWARGAQTLVIASSHSGNTEETLSAFVQAKTNGCRILAVCTGGKLETAANEAGVTLWIFEHRGQPRAAVGFSFGLLLAAFSRLGLIPDPSVELKSAIAAMRAQQVNLRAEVPIVKNPAKRMAGQLMGRWVTVIGAGILAPVARRWKGQISEVAKAWGQFEFLPEADHNTLAGLVNPENTLAQTMVLFLRAPSLHPRNCLRLELTKKIFMLEGLNTDFIDAQDDTPLAQLWTALHLGDYAAYYLAMAYDVDPSPVEAIESLKKEMKR
jgi:glucose/mannose-6-phosphate isomerase